MCALATQTNEHKTPTKSGLFRRCTSQKLNESACSRMASDVCHATFLHSIHAVYILRALVPISTVMLLLRLPHKVYGISEHLALCTHVLYGFQNFCRAHAWIQWCVRCVGDVRAFYECGPLLAHPWRGAGAAAGGATRHTDVGARDSQCDHEKPAQQYPYVYVVCHNAVLRGNSQHSAAVNPVVRIYCDGAEKMRMYAHNTAHTHWHEL